MTSMQSILRLNAASCLGFGALFVVAPESVSGFLGSMPTLVLVILGAGLLVNGTHLIFASTRASIRRAEILWFSLGDLAWWLGSLGLVGAGHWITTKPGILAALVMATAVAAFAMAQLTALGARDTGLSAGAHWRLIGRSWLALPLWVKLWLFALNAVFLASPAFLPWDVASVVLAAYAASGPLVLAFAAIEGGLSKAAGIGHLVPWIPMLVWLAYWLTAGDTGHLASGYAWVLGAAITTCLALDIYDLWRWWHGERQTIGAQTII